jgi:peptide/nickel transport system ATP-binding protein
MPHPLLTINNLSVSFQSGNAFNQAVKNISFQVNKDEIVALVGESGSGKSVTALSLLQLLPSPPAKYGSGEILFSEDGEVQINILQRTNEGLQKIRGNKIAMIFQEPMTSLNPVFTCGQQVMEALTAHKNISKGEAKKQTLYWFEKVKLPNPEIIFGRYPHQLSGGQKQRVMIAMAMCCRPALLICDEPTTALDVTVQKTVLQLIKELQQETGMGVIFITHDLGVVAEIAHRAVVMYKGELTEQGLVTDLFLHPQHPYTKALLACRPVNHKRGERLPVVNDFLSKKSYTSLNAAVLMKATSSETSGKVLMEVENISVHFVNKRNWIGKPISYTKAVDNVRFTVYENETLGIVGESGCGKTTLGRALLQLISVSNGKIIYNGSDLHLHTSETMRELRKHLQIVFQDPYSSLNPRMKIGPAIEEPLAVHHILPNTKERRSRVLELLGKVGLLPEHYDRYPHEFSGGQRQRIVIARALALQPSFLICDESVSALDVSVQAQILNLLNDLKKEFGFTIIFISHDLSVVRYFSDRVIVMNNGKIEEAGFADDIYKFPKEEYTKKLIASIPKGIVNESIIF